MNHDRSVSVATESGSIGAKKLGQPVPDSNLASERNNSLPHPAQRYVPFRCSSHRAPVKGRSVPFSRRTRYCSGVSSVASRCRSWSAPRRVSRHSCANHDLPMWRPDDGTLPWPAGGPRGDVSRRPAVFTSHSAPLPRSRGPDSHVHRDQLGRGVSSWSRRLRGDGGRNDRTIGERLRIRGTRARSGALHDVAGVRCEIATPFAVDRRARSRSP